MKKKKIIIAINGSDTDLTEINVDKYKLVACEKGKSFTRFFYKTKE